MQKYLIGKVLKPRGLKGELKIQILTNLLQVFDKLKSVYLGKTKYIVERSSIQNSFAFIKINGINTIEAAEDFRGMEVFITKSQMKLEEDEILQDDLIGFHVVGEDGGMIGTLDSIESYGERVIFNVGPFTFPYEDDFVLETNMTEKKIVIKRSMLDTEEIR